MVCRKRVLDACKHAAQARLIALFPRMAASAFAITQLPDFPITRSRFLQRPLHPSYITNGIEEDSCPTPQLEKSLWSLVEREGWDAP
jgi:hypothetical protein